MRANERCGSRRSVRFGQLLDRRTRRSCSRYDAWSAEPLTSLSPPRFRTAYAVLDPSDQDRFTIVSRECDG